MTQAAICAIILSCACALPVHAQDSLLLRDFHYVKSTNAWLTSSNAATLTRMEADNLSEAMAAVTSGHGGLTGFSGSPEDLHAGATAESFTRLTPHTVVYGRMRYDNYSGKRMGGSTFIDCRQLPFDIVEDSLTNLGKKHLDTYQLTGGVGTELWKKLSVGARLDYTAANYAKYKDLRHKNKLMDMTLTVGAWMPIGKVLSLGAYYYYRRTTEGVTYSVYGREDKVYKSLINYGPFIGKVEQFGSNGFTDRSREMPMVDDYNGAGLQLGVEAGNVAFINEATIARRKGYYGRKSPYTITFSHHASKTYNYKGSLSVKSHRTLHIVRMEMDVENLKNHFASYREMKNDAGANYYEYHDAVKTANKVWVDGKVNYTALIDVRGEMPSWMLTLGCSWQHRRQTAYLYPYYRRQHLDNREWNVGATRNLLLQKGILSLTLQGAFLHGSGEPYEDFTFATPSDKQSTPATMDTWLHREHMWLTAPQYNVSGIARYAFLFPGTHMKTFVETMVSHRKANTTNPYAVGRDRTTLQFTLGADF